MEPLSDPLLWFNDLGRQAAASAQKSGLARHSPDSHHWIHDSDFRAHSRPDRGTYAEAIKGPELIFSAEGRNVMW